MFFGLFCLIVGGRRGWGIVLIFIGWYVGMKGGWWGDVGGLFDEWGRLDCGNWEDMVVGWWCIFEGGKSVCKRLRVIFVVFIFIKLLCMLYVCCFCRGGWLLFLLVLGVK